MKIWASFPSPTILYLYSVNKPIPVVAACVLNSFAECTKEYKHLRTKSVAFFFFFLVFGPKVFSFLFKLSLFCEWSWSSMNDAWCELFDLRSWGSSDSSRLEMIVVDSYPYVIPFSVWATHAQTWKEIWPPEKTVWEMHAAKSLLSLSFLWFLPLSDTDLSSSLRIMSLSLIPWEFFHDGFICTSLE